MYCAEKTGSNDKWVVWHCHSGGMDSSTQVSKFTLNFPSFRSIFAAYEPFGQIIVFSQSHFCLSLPHYSVMDRICVDTMSRSFLDFIFLEYKSIKYSQRGGFYDKF